MFITNFKDAVALLRNQPSTVELLIKRTYNIEKLELPADEGFHRADSSISTTNKTEMPNIKRLKESDQTRDDLMLQSKLSDAVLPEVIVTSNRRYEDDRDRAKGEYEIVN